MPIIIIIHINTQRHTERERESSVVGLCPMTQHTVVGFTHTIQYNKGEIQFSWSMCSSLKNLN